MHFTGTTARAASPSFSERQFQIRIEREQLAAEHVLDARQNLLVVGIEAQHEDWRRVGCAHETPAVRPVRTHAVDRRHARTFETRALAEAFDEAIVLAFLHLDLELRRARAFREAVEDLL